MYDVVVVGAGPAGSLAAKKCAELGFSTLLLERMALPRDKVCSGMVMGPLAQNIVEEEFGTIPGRVLTEPPYLSGCMVHAPGADPVPVEQRMPFTWRRELDFWMTQGARQAGVEVRDIAKVTSLEQKRNGCTVKLGGEVIETRFVIGADGSRSTIRKLLYPDLEIRYRIVYRECYRGKLDLDSNYLHWFFPRGLPRPRFNVNHKGGFFLMEGMLKGIKNEIFKLLHPYGFSEKQKPLWKDGCLDGNFLSAGPDGSNFVRARGNVMLIGDAALLQLPVSGEGIGTALKSGLLAAQSIAEAVTSRRDAAGIYLRQLKPLLDILKGLYPWNDKIEERSKRGPGALLDAYAEGLKATLKVA